MSNPVFTLDEFHDGDKRLFVNCANGDLRITIDYDDVDQYEAAVLLRKMLHILNDRWDVAEYAPLSYNPVDWGSLSDEEGQSLWHHRYEDADNIIRELAKEGGGE